jgi:hypothetical protein
MPSKKQIRNMLESMSIRDLRILSYYFNIPVSKKYSHIGGSIQYFIGNGWLSIFTTNIFNKLYNKYFRTDERTDATFKKIDTWISKIIKSGNSFGKIDHAKIKQQSVNFELFLVGEYILVEVIRDIVTDFNKVTTNRTTFEAVIFSIIDTLDEGTLKLIQSRVIRLQSTVGKQWTDLKKKSAVARINESNSQKIENIKRFINTQYPLILRILNNLNTIFKLETSKTAIPDMLHKITELGLFIDCVVDRLLPDYKQDEEPNSIYKKMEDKITARLSDDDLITSSARKDADHQIQNLKNKHGNRTRWTVGIQKKNGDGVWYFTQ